MKFMVFGDLGALPEFARELERTPPALRRRASSHSELETRLDAGI